MQVSLINFDGNEKGKGFRSEIDRPRNSLNCWEAEVAKDFRAATFHSFKVGTVKSAAMSLILRPLPGPVSHPPASLNVSLCDLCAASLNLGYSKFIHLGGHDVRSAEHDYFRAPWTRANATNLDENL